MPVLLSHHPLFEKPLPYTTFGMVSKIARRCAEEPSRLLIQESKQGVHLAIDGKALRGTGKQAYGGEQPQKHLLHVYEVETGIVLQQCPIAQEHKRA